MIANFAVEPPHVAAQISNFRPYFVEPFPRLLMHDPHLLMVPSKADRHHANRTKHVSFVRRRFLTFIS